MKSLQPGVFFGNHYQERSLAGINITDTEYTHAEVDWHYHENPYFTYLLQGKVIETNKNESYLLQPGSLLFHHWQDAHCNKKPPGFTRGFHIEISPGWLSSFDLQSHVLKGTVELKNPGLKARMNQLYFETKSRDPHSNTSIEMLLVDIFGMMGTSELRSKCKIPSWLTNLYAMLLESESDYSLTDLSLECNVHPVHLSRTFHAFTGMTLGAFIRFVRLNRAVLKMHNSTASLTEIGLSCGFYDQSHFISSFRKVYGISPSGFMKRIKGGVIRVCP